MDFEQRYRVAPGRFDLSSAPTRDKGAIGKRKAAKRRGKDIVALDELQERLYAEGKQSLLIVLQALDAAGKDSTIEHVMSGVNPQGVRVTSFKQPTDEDLQHPYLWRVEQAAPKPGEIAIFNRSQYEDVLGVRVHPEFLKARDIDPARADDPAFWQGRFDEIKEFEKQLALGGTKIIKFFLNVSLGEQRKRLLARAERPEKNWKFSPGDVEEREFRRAYEEAYADVLRETSTEFAPWYVIPADQKWLMRTAVASIIQKTLEDMSPRYPVLSSEDRAAMDAAVEKLRAEG